MSKVRAIAAWTRENSEIAFFMAFMAVALMLLIWIGTTQTSEILQTISPGV